MSISFNLDEFQKAFDIAVAQQRQERAATDFEFEGQKITVEGSTNLSDAVLSYLESFIEEDNFTGSEKFQEREPGAFIELVKRGNNPTGFLAVAVHAAKLLQQATRNDRPLEEIWSCTSRYLDVATVGILTETWLHGEELKKLWDNERDRRYHQERSRGLLGWGDNDMRP